MTREEMIEFVEALFLTQYLTKDEDEKVKYTNSYNDSKHRMDNWFDLANVITYQSFGNYSLSVRFSTMSELISIRFVSEIRFSSFLDDLHMGNLKEEFSLLHANLSINHGYILNAKGPALNCKDFLIWLYKQIDDYKDKVNVCTFSINDL